VVTDLIRDGGGRVIGVRTDRPDGDLHANVVLLADGINSPLARKTGFRAEPRPENVALAVKELIELPEEVIDARFNVEPGNGVTTEILGEPTWGMNGVASSIRTKVPFLLESAPTWLILPGTKRVRTKCWKL
jgi:electron transfer flavoprotein-quinone oxidoreductase